MTVLHFHMQGEDVVGVLPYWQVARVYIFVYKGKTFLNTIMASVICVRFTELVDRCVT